LPRLKKLWHLTMPTSLEQLETEKKRGDLFTWQLSLESRQGALSSIHSFLVYCNDLLQTNNDSTTSTTNTNTTSSTHHTVDLHKNLVNSILTPIEGAILLLSQLPSIIKLSNNSVVLKAQAATFRLKLYQTLIAMPSPSLFESNFAIILRELVAEFTLADQPSSSLVTSTLRSVCHSNDSILFNNCWLQDADFKAIEDQLQPHSASGCEALEHDVTYLYQRTPSYSSSAIIGLGAGSSASSSAGSSTVSSALLSTSTTGVCNHSNTGINHLTSGINMYSSSTFLTYSFSSSSSIHAANSNSTGCLSALPLGVAVIDAAIQLYGLMYPKVPNKHRLQMLLHFSDCIQKQATSKSNAACKQALQINIFTAVLGSLKSLAETKTDLGDEASIRKATLKLVMETLCHSNPILRCAAGEALGRMTQVVGESHFVIEVAQFCFEKYL
jgi:HEAT repeat-containing protein 5